MRSLLALVAAACLLPAAVSHAQGPSASIQAAVADSARPAADVARDASRHPAELLAFAGVKPGDVVVDLMPGGGYFTRLFAKAVGPAGRVYAVVPEAIVNAYPSAVPAIRKAAAGYSNVVVRVDALSPEPARANAVDLVWTSDNYHDVHNPKVAPGDAETMDTAIFAALKPGGVFVVVDHAAEPGSGVRDAGTRHRIDKATVVSEVTRAGFTTCGESALLANPADTHQLVVFDPAIRGRTDQFALRFCKPG